MHLGIPVVLSAGGVRRRGPTGFVDSATQYLDPYCQYMYYIFLGVLYSVRNMLNALASLQSVFDQLLFKASLQQMITIVYYMNLDGLEALGPGP